MDLLGRIIKTFLLAAIISSASVGSFILFTSQGKGDNFCPGNVWCQLYIWVTLYHLHSLSCPVELESENNKNFEFCRRKLMVLYCSWTAEFSKWPLLCFVCGCKQHEVKGWRQGKDNVNLSCMSIFASNFFRRNRRSDFEGKKNRSRLLFLEGAS